MIRWLLISNNFLFLSILSINVELFDTTAQDTMQFNNGFVKNTYNKRLLNRIILTKC